MAEQAVSNASPLIFPSRGGHLPLLRAFADRVLGPEAVASEIRAKGPDDCTAQALEATAWLEVVPSVPVPEEVMQWGLGAGESGVLAAALLRPGLEAIIDDLAGRRCARSLGVTVRGTLGIVLVARQRGAISEARPVLGDLIRGGMYLSRYVLDAALARVGE